MTGFPAAKLTTFVDPIAHAWAIVNPRHPLPRELGGPGGVSRPLPDLPGSLRDKPLIESQPVAPCVQAPARLPDAELGPGKFLGNACPHGHRVRYVKTKACVACLRAAVKRCNELAKQKRAA